MYDSFSCNLACVVKNFLQPGVQSLWLFSFAAVVDDAQSAASIIQGYSTVRHEINVRSLLFCQC